MMTEIFHRLMYFAFTEVAIHGDRASRISRTRQTGVQTLRTKFHIYYFLAIVPFSLFSNCILHIKFILDYAQCS